MIRMYPGSDEWFTKGGTQMVRATFLSDEELTTTSLTGADVEELSDDVVLAFGSVLIAPSKNYIAFSDGEFTEKA